MNLETRYAKGIIGIVAIFAVGLVLFFIFSAGYGDGLERTIEEAGVEEQDPVYSAPLDYGEDWPTAFLAGIVGFTVVFVVVIAYLKVSNRRKSETEGEK
jgi:cobalt/nickel transport protein